MTLLERIRESKWLQDFEPPRSVCVAGAAVLPPVGFVVLAGLFLLSVYYGRQIYQHYNPPILETICAATLNGTFCWANPALEKQPREATAAEQALLIIVPWTPYIVGGLIVGAIWTILGMIAYIHCHQFWHGVKPDIGLSEGEIWHRDFLYCRQCFEGDSEWHDLGECEHLGTTP